MVEKGSFHFSFPEHQQVGFALSLASKVHADSARALDEASRSQDFVGLGPNVSSLQTKRLPTDAVFSRQIRLSLRGWKRLKKDFMPSRAELPKVRDVTRSKRGGESPAEEEGFVMLVRFKQGNHSQTFSGMTTSGLINVCRKKARPGRPLYVRVPADSHSDQSLQVDKPAINNFFVTNQWKFLLIGEEGLPVPADLSFATRNLRYYHVFPQRRHCRGPKFAVFRR